MSTESKMRQTALLLANIANLLESKKGQESVEVNPFEKPVMVGDTDILRASNETLINIIKGLESEIKVYIKQLDSECNNENV